MNPESRRRDEGERVECTLCPYPWVSYPSHAAKKASSSVKLVEADGALEALNPRSSPQQPPSIALHPLSSTALKPACSRGRVPTTYDQQPTTDHLRPTTPPSHQPSIMFFYCISGSHFVPPVPVRCCMAGSGSGWRTAAALLRVLPNAIAGNAWSKSPRLKIPSNLKTLMMASGDCAL